MLIVYRGGGAVLFADRVRGFIVFSLVNVEAIKVYFGDSDIVVF